jgi:hypothetical protein
MRKALFAGILAGLAAGIPIGLLLSAIVPSDVGLPDHSLMELLAGAMSAKGVAPGWIATLGASALLGAIFSGFVRRAGDAGRVSSVALFFGLSVWAIVAAFGVPLLIGARPVVGLANIRVWPLVVGALMLHLLFSSVLAVAFLWLRGPRQRAEATEVRELRRAA